MKIGITQRVDKIIEYGEIRDSLDVRMIRWVSQSGFIPIPIPNGLVDISKPHSEQLELESWLKILKIDALVLSGGNDIGTIAERDLTEKYLLNWSEKKKIPVLGICRGMQMIAFYKGAELKSVEGHVNTRHVLNSNLNNVNEIFPETVNSYHNQSLVSCPESFKVLAVSEDGNIEAIAHKQLPWEAWMWHPEREDIFSSHDISRIKKLFTNNKGG